MTQKRPNIVVVMWHDLGDWLGCYGFLPSPSPNADRLATEGALLSNYFACAPICCPSRAGMMTSLMPHANGVNGQINRGWDMGCDVRPLPAILREAGYATHLVGFSHECQDPLREGFEEVLNGGDENRERGARAIFERQVGSEQPFFLTITTTAVHRAFGDRHDPSLAEQITPPAWMPDLPSTRTDLACFHRYISEADAQLGAILRALDDTGHTQNTIFIFTTDHGAPFARAKHSLYDPGLRMACIVRWPGHIKAGSRISALLSNLDFAPTVQDLVALPSASVGAVSHGRSFAALFTGIGTHEPRTEIFAEHTYGVLYWPTRCIRTDRYKYICNFEPRQPIMHEPFLVARSGTHVANQYYSAQVPPEELYDLENDPHEFCNLANDPRHCAIRRDLRGRLFGFLRDTADSLLDGPVPDPSGEHTPGRTFDRMWSADETGLYHSDLPPQWQPDRFTSKS